MHIVYPNCGARYLVDPAAIGRHGRTVQCFRCGYKWMAHVEAGDTRDAVEAALSDTQPAPDFIIRPQDQGEQGALPAVPRERGIPTWLKLALGVLILFGMIGGAGYALAVAGF